MGFWAIFIGVLFLVICFLLIVVVLLQKGKGGGLGAAFGGMGSSAFGTRTGDVFTWVTIVLTGLFLLLAVGTSLLFRPTSYKVFTPSFLPPPGAVTEGTRVQISCRTHGAVIRFATDGSDPDEDSALYDKPIVIDGTMTIKAIGIRPTWENSDIAVGRYTLADANAPASQPATAPGGD